MSFSTAVSRNLPTDVPQAFSLDRIPNPILILDQTGLVLDANAAAREQLGHDIIGIGLWEIFQSDEQILEAREGDVRAAVTCIGNLRYRLCSDRAQDGTTVLSLFPDGLADVGAPETDELTGLLNRAALMRQITECLGAADKRNAMALHFIDLDRFKLVNDTLGHAIGDLLLKKVADRIRSACRAGERIGRMGGDEIVVLQKVSDPCEAQTLAARLVDLLGRTYVLGGHTINIGASVGVAMAEEGLGARDLLRNGDLALYEAKRSGRGRFRLFESGMDAALRERRELEIDLRRALALKQFELHYQPFIDLETDEVMGYEALIRWEHPTRGRVSPAAFIPLAEETGLITKIGEWVLRTACTTAMRWPEDVTVAVNVSPVQFKADALVPAVVSALAHAGLPPHRLELEITEGALLDDTPAVLKTLYALRDLGVKISMDDFGTGYSSLSYLQKFPFNKIKIDRSFVQGADQGGDSAAILKAIARLGVSLGMAITAEGVETVEQLERIRSEKCTHVQGYLTGRPQPADQLPSNRKDR